MGGSGYGAVVCVATPTPLFLGSKPTGGQKLSTLEIQNTITFLFKHSSEVPSSLATGWLLQKRCHSDLSSSSGERHVAVVSELSLKSADHAEELKRLQLAFQRNFSKGSPANEWFARAKDECLPLLRKKSSESAEENLN